MANVSVITLVWYEAGPYTTMHVSWLTLHAPHSGAVMCNARTDSGWRHGLGTIIIAYVAQLRSDREPLKLLSSSLSTDKLVDNTADPLLPDAAPPPHAVGILHVQMGVGLGRQE